MKRIAIFFRVQHPDSNSRAIGEGVVLKHHLAVHELGLSDSEALYAEFRRLVEDLGYKSTQVGFSKQSER